MPRAHPSSRSFTLIELMVVVAILGLLATVVSVSVIGSIVDARIGVAKADIRRLADGVKLFRLQYHRYPRNLDELLDPPSVNGSRRAPYFEARPIDPWERPYVYQTRGGEFEILTLGLSGEPGGEGEEGDLRWSELQQSGRRAR